MKLNYNNINYIIDKKSLNTKFKVFLWKFIPNMLWLSLITIVLIQKFIKTNTIPSFGFLTLILLLNPIFEILILSKNFFFRTWLQEIFLTHLFLIIVLFSDFIFHMYNSQGTLVIITNLWTWLDFSPGFIIDFKLFQSSLFLLGAFLVSLAGIAILGFSVNYISNFELIRFCLLILCFIISMLINILASDWLLMFIGWEGIGLMSFILINFWKSRHEANKSALKAFFVNKVGDILIIIICALTFAFVKNSFFLAQILYLYVPNKQIFNLFIFLLIASVLGKSAQFFFHFWLDDAMEGPTPVSALIHAATLVTAGSFLIFKNHLFLLKAQFSTLLIIIGIFSALSGIFASLEQDDLKKTIAYTTLTNIGLVFTYCGLGLLNLGFFHLLTHGFYKALTFLTVGNYIHFTGGEQSIFFKGISGKKFVFDYFFLFLSSILMIGIPFFGAFYSKEPLFNLNNYSSNFFFILLLFSIFCFGVISNFSLLSAFFINVPSRLAKLIIPEYHRPDSQLDLILVILSAIAISVPILIYNLIFINRVNLISLNSLSILNLESAFILLEQSQLNSNFAMIIVLFISVSLLNISNKNQIFISKIFGNSSLGDKIILGFVNFSGILISKFTKLAVNFFWLNEYVLLEFFFFQNLKKMYKQIYVLLQFNNSSKLFLIIQFCSFVIIYTFLLVFLFI